MNNINFWGEKLREIRELRGYTIQQVADYIGVSKQSISLYEKAKCKPLPGTFQKLVELFKVPSHFFSCSPILPHTTPTFYRSMASATKQMRDVAEQKLKWLRSIIAYLSNFIDFPTVNIPSCHFPSDPTKISDADVELASDNVRRFWGLGNGVISNVVHLLENNGIIVSRFALNSDKLDAFSIMEDGTERPYVIMASDKGSPFRARFDAAHELGHIILHRNVPKQLLRDRDVFNVLEDQANLFASTFLLPERSFGLERLTSNIKSFVNIKKKWLASIASMIMRAAQLGIISDSQKTSLWIERSRRKWSKVEPFDDEHEVELPSLVSKSFQMIVSEGLVSKEQILSDLAMNQEDFEAMTGLEGFLSENGADNIHEPVPTLKFPSRTY